jgi:hypothetical protein
MEPTLENIRLLPLAAVGIVLGLAEVVVKPFVTETAQKVSKAAITYYRSPSIHDLDYDNFPVDEVRLRSQE